MGPLSRSRFAFFLVSFCCVLFRGPRRPFVAVLALPGGGNESLRCPYSLSPFSQPSLAATVCKSCLVAYFHKGKTDCPHCGVRLGQQPQFRYDRTLQCLVDKVFPEFQEAERINEEPFYADRGIKRKALVPSQAPGAGTSRPPKRPSGPVSGPVECAETSFKLEPSPNAQEEDQLQELSRPFLRASGQLRVMHLKKFLTKKLGLERPDQIEILCKGDILGGELSLDFIKRTRWYDSSDLVLHYCRPSKERPQIM